MSSKKSNSILLLGAGKSASYLIQYLSNWCADKGVNFVIADLFESALVRLSEITSKPFHAVLLKENDVELLESTIASAEVVISMLPVAFHYQVALLCIKNSKNLLTASYILPELKLLEEEVKNKSLTFLFECGLDPGIDHMSAFAMLSKIQKKGEKVTSFISSTGGLVDPLCEGDNPWQYKFTWNPRNVVLAGKDGAIFKNEGSIKEVTYKELFSTALPLTWKGEEDLEIYANRDSLQYQLLYGLKDADTFIRGTIRRAGYSSAWNVLVLLGMTDDEIVLAKCKTYREFLKCFVKESPFTRALVEKEIGITVSERDWNKINSLSLDTNFVFVGNYKTAAQYLQAILEVKWVLKDTDKDWVLMQHRVKTVKDDVVKEYVSTLSVKGENKLFTAMSKTVGLPLAMAAILVYTKQWLNAGINVPSDPNLYNLLLLALEKEGIVFEEEEF